MLFIIMQVLFKPLLGSMGLESVRMSALMKELGGSLSLRGSLSSVRVKIIDSDFEMERTNITGRRHDDAPRGKVSIFLVGCTIMFQGQGQYISVGVPMMHQGARSVYFWSMSQ